jgi:sporulation protein YlmC with PRC-barrel domain
MKLTALTPDARNANRGTERGRKLVRESLKRYGAGRSILIDKSGNIIAGNKTVEGAKAVGLEDVQIVKSDGTRLVAVQRTDLDINDKAARELAIADNRASELGLEWDTDVLKALETEVDVDLGPFWDERELVQFWAKTDAAGPNTEPSAILEEYQLKWNVQRGQLYQVGPHRVLCDDGQLAENRERLLQGDKPTLLHTDPPYGISIVAVKNTANTGVVGGGKPFGRVNGENRHTSTGFDARGTVQKGPKSPNQIIHSNVYPVIQGDDKPFNPEPLLDLAPIVILWGANYYADQLSTTSCWLVWDKRENFTRNSFADGELAWCNQKAPLRIFHHLWNGLHKGSQHGERRTHPTEKPIALFEEIGNLFSPQGLWLDLYAGSGAQFVAAHRAGARCVGCDLEPLYVAATLERLEREGLKPELTK